MLPFFCKTPSAFGTNNSSSPPLFAFKCTFQMAGSSLDEMSDSGAFMRTASTFHNFFSRDPPESGTYHLYVSYAWPWASRCLAYLKIRGLDKAIGFRSNPYGKGQRKLMSIWGGFFPPLIQRSQMLNLTPPNGAETIRELYCEVLSSCPMGREIQDYC